MQISRMVARKTGAPIYFPIVFTCALSKDMGAIEAELGTPIYAVSQTPQVPTMIFRQWGSNKNDSSG